MTQHSWELTDKEIYSVIKNHIFTGAFPDLECRVARAAQLKLWLYEREPCPHKIHHLRLECHICMAEVKAALEQGATR